MSNQLTDSTTGRTSAWLAKSSSAYVMLVDPATGLPYKASGGGGGGGSSFADLLYIDSTGQQFFYQDTGSGLASYKTQNGAYVAYTPVAPVKPYAVAEVTANAGTNLNTSALALESGGNLAALASASSDSAVSGSATSAAPFVVNNTTSKGTLAFTVTGTWTGTIIVEGTTDGTNWTPTSYVALTSGNSSTTFTANTAGQINTVGLTAIRFRSNTIASGTANFTGVLSRNVSNVMLDNPLPSGSNNIGSVNNITGTVSLPTGASTAALQTSMITALGSPLQAGGAVSVSNFPATQPVSGAVSVSNFPATQAVSGTVSVGNFPATQAVSAASLPLPTGAATAALQTSMITALGSPLQAGGAVSVSNFPATQPVSGTVAVGNFPATQTISGAVSVSNFPATQPVSAASLPLPTGAATSALQTTGNTTLTAIQTALGTPLQAGGAVSVSNFPATQPVSGTVSVGNFPATQPVSAASLPLPTGAATAALQTALNTSVTDGTQKTAIVQMFTYSPNNSTNGNSTAVALATGNTWNGTLEAAINQNFATISVISTQAVTMTVNQYLDAAGTIVDVVPVNFTVSANTPYTFPVAIQGNYVKLAVSNASGVSASVTVDTYYGPLPVEPASLTQAGNKKVSVQEQLVSISTLNSSTTQLTAGSTFTGAWEAVLNTASVQVSSIADQATTITIQQAQDLAGAKIIRSSVYTRAAGLPFAESLLVVGTYLRLLVQNNGASTTTTFSAQTISTPVMNQSPVGPDNSGNMPVGISQAVYGPTGTNAVFVGGTSQVQVTPAVTAASAYVTGNVVGGLITFANAVQATVLSGVLESVTLAIKSTQTATFKLYLFSSAPSTTFTDKTAPAIGTGDAAKLLDVISLAGGDSGLGANSTLYVADNIGKSLVLAGTALYGVLIVAGTPTFTTTSDVVVTASILKD